MDTVDNRSLDRKRLLLFVAVTYGISYLMMIPIGIGKKNGIDPTQIVNAQMCSPAAAVALGFLLFHKGEKRIPKMFMTLLIINYSVQMILGLLTVFADPFGPDKAIDIAKLIGFSGDVSKVTGIPTTFYLSQLYFMAGQLFAGLGSILLWISYFAAGAEKREFAGLSRKNEIRGICLIMLFALLYLGKVFIPGIIKGAFSNRLSEVLGNYSALFEDPVYVAGFLSLPFKYPLTVIMFFGSEYGWRYFLQPVMQKKFGMRSGVILLGIAWGLWHLPIDLLVYTDDSIPQVIAVQIITCVSLGIFWGFAYLKTNNLWVPVCMHFLHENLIAVLSGNLSGMISQNQHATWMQVLEILVLDLLVFCLFIFAREFKENKNAGA